MSFTSIKFVLFFLPITIIIFQIFSKFKKKLLAKVWIIFVSIVFYYSFDKNIYYLLLLIGTIVFNFLIGRILLLINKEKKILRTFFLIIGLIENFGFLLYYKYTDFFLNIINKSFNKNLAFKSFILPLGISFFTFRLLSYVIDCYKNKSEKYSLIDFLLFGTFFPVITMGPISRHEKFISQLNNKFLIFNTEAFTKGMFRFAIGFSKKVLIATPLINYTTQILNPDFTLSPFEYLLALAANFFSFYFDFSGYTDMAIGISGMLNLKISENFKSPYKARNIREYWKGWHLSLTSFLNEYVFNNIYKPGHSVYRFCFATMITFIISGFWHGAGFNYILWGFIHGLCISVTAFVAINVNKKYLMPKFLARTLTIILLIFLASLYSTNSFSFLKTLYKNTFNFSYYIDKGFSSSVLEIINLIIKNINVLIITLISLVITFYCKNSKQITDKYGNKTKGLLLAGLFFGISILSLSEVSNFLYQNF